MRIAIVGFVIACSSFVACRDVVSTCDGSARAAIRLSVLDAQTNSAISGQVKIVWTAPNGSVDSLTMSGEDAAISVPIGFVAGTYHVRINQPGYAQWQDTPDVASDGCKPITKPITAALNR